MGINEKFNEFNNKVCKIWQDVENRAERRRAESHVWHVEFRDWLFEEFGVTGNPKAQKVFDLAWDYGHENGFSGIYFFFADIVVLIK